GFTSPPEWFGPLLRVSWLRLRRLRSPLLKCQLEHLGQVHAVHARALNHLGAAREAVSEDKRVVIFASYLGEELALSQRLRDVPVTRLKTKVACEATTAGTDDLRSHPQLLQHGLIRFVGARGLLVAVHLGDGRGVELP